MTHMYQLSTVMLSVLVLVYIISMFSFKLLCFERVMSLQQLHCILYNKQTYNIISDSFFSFLCFARSRYSTRDLKNKLFILLLLLFRITLGDGTTPNSIPHPTGYKYVKLTTTLRHPFNILFSTKSLLIM